MSDKSEISKTKNDGSFESENRHDAARVLSALIGLASSLNGSHSFESLLNNFTKGLKDIWPDAGIRLFEVDRGSGYLIPMDWLASDPVPIRGSLIGDIAADGKPKIIRHLDDHPGYMHGHEAPPGLKWDGLIACPVPVNGDTAYLIGVYRTDKHPVSEKDLELLTNTVTILEPLLARWESQEKQIGAFMQIAKAIASAVDARDPYLVGHGDRVSEFAQAIARTHGLETKFIERLSLAGLLHDLGRLGIPESILSKPGNLTPEEMNIVKSHPGLSVRFLERVEYLSDTFSSIRHHHEKYDGSGYPDGLEGEDIPLGARILTVADAFDAMTSPRPFRGPKTDAAALKELKKNAGKQFDPIIVEAFVRAHDERLILSQNVLQADDPLANLRMNR
ncbi:MAG: HD domain-containing protein [bacterium]|nr:HD domain-containing protein [bacterium]